MTTRPPPSAKDSHARTYQDRLRLTAFPMIWADFWGVKGAPTVYKTKRDAVTAIERYIDVLIDKISERI